MLHDFTKDKFDVIILAGQSNAEGCGLGPVEDPYVPDGRVFHLYPNGTIAQAADDTFYNDLRSHFALPFAREYIRAGMLAEDRKLLILRCAVGGTGFWNNCWGLADHLYLQMLEMTRTALALNPENRLVALLWHQGEADALSAASFESYYKNLSDLLTSVRETFSAPDLPFVAGDFVQGWKAGFTELCAPVIEATRAVCRDCGPGGFAETDGLLSNFEELDYHPMGWWENDTIHFSRRAVYELGKRYFAAFAACTAPDAEAGN
jgi:hypothetical protein